MKKIGLIWKVLISILLGIVLGSFMPQWFVRIFQTFNGIFSQYISFCVPLIILALIAAAIADTKKGAGRMLVWTLGLAYFSTLLVGFIAYFTGNLIFPSIIEANSGISQTANGAVLTPYFTMTIPPALDVMSALFLAFILGLGILSTKSETLYKATTELRDIVMLAITKSIVPLLPLYIFSIFISMTAEGTVTQVLGTFFKVIIVVFALQVVWLVGLYLAAGIIDRKRPLRSLATMLSAYVTALATSSSAATIPVTLRQTKKLGVDEKVADFTIPLCANIHLSGSAMKIVMFSMAVMIMQGMHYDIASYATFIFLVGITLVAAPGVPGGAIMAALSILQSVLGFGAEEQALMISLYIAVDSFGTACNVTGDGAITMIVDRIVKQKETSQEK